MKCRCRTRQTTHAVLVGVYGSHRSTLSVQARVAIAVVALNASGRHPHWAAIAHR